MTFVYHVTSDAVDPAPIARVVSQDDDANGLPRSTSWLGLVVLITLGVTGTGAPPFIGGGPL